jgi:hypothetical protein
MTSRKITVRAIFGKDGLPTRFLFPIDGKYCFMDCQPSNDASIDEFCMEMMPPSVTAQPEHTQNVSLEVETQPNNTDV